MRLNLGAVLHVTHAYVGAMVDAGLGPDRHDRLRRRPPGRAHPGDLRRGQGRARWASCAGLAAEVGAHGVTANCVALGTMKTGALEEALDARTPSSRRKLARPYTSRGSARPRIRPLLVALLCSEAGALDHRPGVPGRRRLRLRPLAARRPGARRGCPGHGHDPCVANVGGVSFGPWLRAVSPSLARARKRAKARVKQPGPRWRDELPSSSPTTASTRSRSAWSSSACSACSRCSPISSARSAAAIDAGAAAAPRPGQVPRPDRTRSRRAASTLVQRRQ